MVPRDQDEASVPYNGPPVQGRKRFAEPRPGYEECYECWGDGACFVCGGTGKFEGERCYNCNGSGRCLVCRGAGQIPEGEV